MPSGADYADRLLKEIRAAVSEPIARFETEIASLENELRGYQERIRDSLERMAGAIRPVGAVEIPAVEALFSDVIAAATTEAQRASEQGLRELEEQSVRIREETEARADKARSEAEARADDARRETEVRSEALRALEERSQEALRGVEERSQQALRDADERSQQALRDTEERSQQALRDADERSQQALRDAEERSQQALRDAEERSQQALRNSEEQSRRAVREAEERSAQALGEVEQKRQAEAEDLARFAREIRRRETQEEILTALLDGAGRCAPRSILFVARGADLVSWASRGFSQSKTEQLSGASLSPASSPLLGGALDSGYSRSAVNLASEPALAALLGSEATVPMHAFTLRALNRPVAVLLAASDGSRASNRGALDVAIELTGLCIDTLALRVMQEISGGSRVEPRRAPPHPTGPTPQTAARPSVEPAGPPLAAHVAEPADATPAAEAAEPPAPVEAAAAAEVPVSSEVAPSAIAPPPVAPPPVPPPAEPTEEERLHAEARRFARLLVSEIKLYNEQRVVDGRANRDVYVRLKRDIDRSREMYEKRISPDVSRKNDYFHDELVRILGENDPSKLGSDYPGPRGG